ncbi:hypothetical protein [Streptomyces sp. CdTB01]|uniref:hypothetical protein n=1 Tax=Streptomyces sp. CdTB01 TaxID=1725411 RepID=UPI00073A53F4|nr:hypothetical protein [Streptomyces sp. CdTB01]ALV36036.1 hypothetical protein AS200_31330 [Streptomyces sp. CdTB01]
MNCGSTGNPAFDLAKGFFEFLGDPIGTIVELIAKTILAGAIAVFGALTTGVPTLTGTTTAKDVNGQTQWLVVYLAVGSLLFASARMAIERRGTAGTTALKGMLRVIAVSGGATTIVTAAAAVADDYSTHLFNTGAQDVLTKVGACSDGSGIEAFLLLILAFLLLIAGIIQTILMYIRLGVMILLLGTLPLAAAASMTDWGGGWWRKHIGWMIAWLLYKPAAGLVLYAGSQMIVSSQAGGQGGNAVNERIAGIGVMLLSAVALPALLKLVVPATAALGGASAYSGAMQSVGGGLATGARSLGGSGGSGGQGSPGPSGASGGSGGSGSSGASGASGSDGAGGASGGGKSSAGGGGSAAGGGGAASGAGRAAAAAGGPAGVAIAAAVTAAQVVGRAASGSLEGADGDQGHNPSPHHR